MRKQSKFLFILFHFQNYNIDKTIQNQKLIFKYTS